MVRQVALYLTRFPQTATALYVAVVIMLIAIATAQVISVEQRRSMVAAAASSLQQLEGRNSGAQSGTAADPIERPGSPFLVGATVTVAGAALLQRMTAAVVRVGGNVLSSQVDLQGSQSKQGFVTVSASCELEQPALQQLLYDIEAGMPFLFVDQLVVQAPAVNAANTNNSGGKLRVLISVSGQWQGQQ